jgi:hypothetical protein
MTTIAYHQYTNIPYMSGGYASAPVSGPLSTNRTPLAMGKHNYGVLNGIHPNPPQFGVTDGASQFSNARHQYLRTASYAESTKTGTEMYSPLKPTSVFNAGTQRSYLLSQSTKYIAPTSSSMYISTRKAQAVGKSSYKQGLPASAPMSYKSFNTNDVKSALRFSRAGGCVAPAKKGSIYNTSLCNGRVCAWGSLVSQNY